MKFGAKVVKFHDNNVTIMRIYEILVKRAKIIKY